MVARRERSPNVFQEGCHETLHVALSRRSAPKVAPVGSLVGLCIMVGYFFFLFCSEEKDLGGTSPHSYTKYYTEDVLEARGIPIILWLPQASPNESVLYT